MGLIDWAFTLKFSLSFASVDPVAVNASFEEARAALIRQMKEKGEKKKLKSFPGIYFGRKKKLSCLFSEDSLKCAVKPKKVRKFPIQKTKNHFFVIEMLFS